MLAVGFMRYGGPEVLEIYDLPEVHAGPGQLRIRNYAATVNPADIMTRSGMLSEQQKGIAPPYVPGMEAAGVVDEVGEDVTTSVKVGDSVARTRDPPWRSWCISKAVVLNAQSVVPVPCGKSYAEACTLPMNGLTARMSLDLLNLSLARLLPLRALPGPTVAMSSSSQRLMDWWSLPMHLKRMSDWLNRLARTLWFAGVTMLPVGFASTFPMALMDWPTEQC